ncbi:SMI1/KNR4 family protein [Tuwongella immobilis]|uniref:Knr4/Smi1-like domain-containing protein n=1 Tax=Tuwongella immobilis TaxID=692036 RepID=A0A6C2YQ12_9BACT|nr:SMI1/KNR4 family protein [Tuwongella immobilis]VIP03728.1 Uncharacterized protein OS=Streptosporangium roseum (strain ATCC 12428 / DSM 43021 / JCM 3005 / NI 9100) GN=Sros_9077 PE=4 SV=1 [Tuwongella immobilis]VTS04824.1 Uncharacterized protein OS=Streptosporangium roseum (strain ATCC 12428 / DSM 43021 / JCM 3005 / NI 9100) GN=Sros_9077 PE=4 SV=1 [Tuwongella immobilis]
MRDSLIQRLCGLVAPPIQPCYNKGMWDEVERELGLSLPLDYKRLIETFGQGVFVGEAFCSGLIIASYLGPAKPSERAKGFSAYFQDVEAIEFGIYPETPGLLGFGSYADKDTIAWNTVGSPEEWPIVFHDPESGFHELKDVSLLDFVISMLEESGQLHKTGVIRIGNMKGPHTFTAEP